MKLRVLGCSGAEFPGHNPTAFLLDDSLLLDAGTVGAVLEQEEQWRIRDILVTHSHLDHVRGIPLLADNIMVKGLDNSLNLFATGETLDAIRVHLLNGVIWPDFTRIPSLEKPIVFCVEIFPEEEFQLLDYRITAFPVNHTVPTVGYRITKGAATLLYTGDTGPTERIWQMAGEVSALLVDVSFPNDMEDRARLTGHLTPSLLLRELAKLAQCPGRILVTHLKPQYYARIQAELEATGIGGLEILKEGSVHEL